MTDWRSKLIGPVTAIILAALAVLLVLDVSFWVFRPWNAKGAVSGSELVVTLENSATGVLIQPNGASQVTGTESSASGKLAIRIPKLEQGDYSLVLRGLSNGESRFIIEALHDGQPAFSYTGSANVTPESEWLVRLHVNVLDGLVQDVRVVSYAPGSTLPGSSNEPSADGKAMPSSLDKLRSSLLGGMKQASSYVANQWVTVGCMLFLALVLAVIWKKR